MQETFGRWRNSEKRKPHGKYMHTHACPRHMHAPGTCTIGIGVILAAQLDH